MTEPHRPSHAYREDCPGCQVCIFNAETGKRMTDDDPVMKMVNKVWWEATFEERSACNRVWVHQSRAKEDLKICGEVCARIEKSTRN